MPFVYFYNLCSSSTSASSLTRLPPIIHLIAAIDRISLEILCDIVVLCPLALRGPVRG